MLDSNVQFIMLLLPMLITLIGGYFLIKRLKKEAISIIGTIIDGEKALIKADLEGWINSDVGAKALYSLGGMVGAGAMAGTGLKKGSGKFKWQDLALEVASGFLKRNIPQIGLNPDSPQNLKAKTDTIPNAR